MIKRKNLIIYILFAIMFILLTLIFCMEISSLERVVLPFCITGLLGGLIFVLLNVCFKDKFISKIYLISILLHFIFALFWQILKYYLLDIPIPSEYSFHGYVSDVDGGKYHLLGVYLSKHLSICWGNESIYGGLFPKLIGVIYHYITINPFIVCLFNIIIVGFVAPIWYVTGKILLQNRDTAQIYSFFSVCTFSHIMNTSTLIRDGYITVFIYLALLFSYSFYHNKKVLYLLLTLLSLYFLYMFRPYAAYIIFFAIVTTFVVINIKIRKHENKISINKLTLAILFLSPIILFTVALVLNLLLNSFGTILSVEDIISIRETAYVGSNTDYTMDFGALYNKFFLLPFVIGYICLFFAPFPWEWVLVRRIIYVPDMIILYCFLPSFFRNLKSVFTDKNYFLTVFFFSILFMFSIYCITLGNSGSIHRLRGVYIPMIYLIAMYRPNKFLAKILNKIKKWGII